MTLIATIANSYTYLLHRPSPHYTTSHHITSPPHNHYLNRTHIITTSPHFKSRNLTLLDHPQLTWTSNANNVSLVYLWNGPRGKQIDWLSVSCYSSKPLSVLPA